MTYTILASSGNVRYASGTRRTRSRLANRPLRCTACGSGGNSLASLIDFSVAGRGSGPGVGSGPGGGSGSDGGLGSDGGSGPEGGSGSDGGLGSDGGSGPEGGPGLDGGLGSDGGFGPEGGPGSDGGSGPEGGFGSDGGSGPGGGADPGGDPGQSIQNGTPTQGFAREGMSYNWLIAFSVPSAASDLTLLFQILSPPFSTARILFTWSVVSIPGFLPSSIKTLLSI